MKRKSNNQKNSKPNSEASADSDNVIEVEENINSGSFLGLLK